MGPDCVHIKANVLYSMFTNAVVGPKVKRKLTKRVSQQGFPETFRTAIKFTEISRFFPTTGHREINVRKKKPNNFTVSHVLRQDKYWTVLGADTVQSDEVWMLQHPENNMTSVPSSNTSIGAYITASSSNN